MYESNKGDATIAPHFDEWFGVIVQMRGAKVWILWEDVGQPPQRIITRQGDMLLLPPTVYHAVETPEYSMHMTFAVLAHKPLAEVLGT